MLTHYDPGITLTMTTCRRFDYFCKTVDSFFQHCKDADKIVRVIVCDNLSSDEDKEAMAKRYPHFEFHWWDCGHAKTLDTLFKMVTTEHLFHLEDDRPMLRSINLMETCLAVMQQADIDSFVCGLRIGQDTGKVQQLHGREEFFYVHEFIDDGRFWSDWNLGDTSWPGFYLAPGMHRVRSITSIPYLQVPQHERNYALKYQAAGFRTAFNAGPHLFDHLTDVSAYVVTNAPR